MNSRINLIVFNAFVLLASTLFCVGLNTKESLGPTGSPEQSRNRIMHVTSHDKAREMLIKDDAYILSLETILAKFRRISNVLFVVVALYSLTMLVQTIRRTSR